MDKPQEVSAECHINQCHKVTYQNKTDYISNHLDIDSILGTLLTKGIIKLKAYQEITHRKDNKGPIAAANLLLTESLMMNPDAASFYVFINILRDAGQVFLAEVLEKEYKFTCQCAQMIGKTKETKPSSEEIKQPSSVKVGSNSTSADVHNVAEVSRTPVMQETGGRAEFSASTEELAMAATGATNTRPLEPVHLEQPLEPLDENKVQIVKGITAEKNDAQQQQLQNPGTVPNSELDQAQPSLFLPAVRGPSNENPQTDITSQPDTDEHICEQPLENLDETKGQIVNRISAEKNDAQQQQQSGTVPVSELDQTQLSLFLPPVGGPTTENPQTDTDEHMSAKFKLDGRKIEIDRNKMLGGGRFGNVYWCKYHDKQYAVKELLQLKYRKNFERNIRENKEIKACAEVQHPSIVEFIGYLEGKQNAQSTLLLVFELVHGQNLDAILHGTDQTLLIEYQLTNAKKYDITKQIGQAVDYIHKKKILHRDIKPANVLVTKANEAKLCDLGLCKFKEGNTLVSTMGKPQGTPLYMAFELVLENEKASEASDIYSFGATMYDLFSETIMWDIEDEDLEKLEHKMRSGKMPQELQNPGDTQPWKLIAECVGRNPLQRPVISKVLDTLQRLS